MLKRDGQGADLLDSVVVHDGWLDMRFSNAVYNIEDGEFVVGDLVKVSDNVNSVRDPLQLVDVALDDG